MREIVTADKKLFLCFQKKDWSLDKYMREFMMRKEVCKEIGSTPGKCLKSARLAAVDDNKDYDVLSRRNDEGDKAKAYKYIKLGQDQYLAALHFEGLNNIMYHEL